MSTATATAQPSPARPAGHHPRCPTSASIGTRSRGERSRAASRSGAGPWRDAIRRCLSTRIDLPGAPAGRRRAMLDCLDLPGPGRDQGDPGHRDQQRDRDRPRRGRAAGQPGDEPAVQAGEQPEARAARRPRAAARWRRARARPRPGSGRPRRSRTGPGRPSRRAARGGRQAPRCPTGPGRTRRAAGGGRGEQRPPRPGARACPAAADLAAVAAVATAPPLPSRRAAAAGRPARTAPAAASPTGSSPAPCRTSRKKDSRSTRRIAMPRR